jgi:osmotically-inducible protein OsmY
MSLKEFTSRCSAITLITASAFGIAQAAEAASTRAAPATSSTQSPAADGTLTERVKAALHAHNIGGLAIQTELGVVTLTGTVINEQQRQKVASIALAVQGVHGVDTGLLKIQRVS